MLQTCSHDINLQKHPSLKRTTSTVEPNYSLWFFTGFNLLRIYVCCKENAELFTTFEKSLIDLISLIKTNYFSYIQRSIELYEQILDNLKKSPNKGTSALWLNTCVDPKYQESLKSIIDLGQYLTFCIVKHFQVNYEELFRSNQVKVLELLSQYFKIYIHIFTNSTNYLVAENFGFQSFVCYAYYSNDHFYIIQTENPTSFDDIQLIDFESYSDSVGIVNRQQFLPQTLSIEFFQDLDNFPSLLKLVDLMVELIIEKGLFTKKVKDCLELALNEDKNLGKLAGVMKGSKTRETFCEVHKIKINLKLNCNQLHCKECIFDKILKNFSKDNYIIYCPCDKQIPPKEINSLKGMPDYQEFSSRNKRK